ncbi:hypothetical protein TPA0910_12710 [Streptomyces hygroscopicus subsp. sporocinereus]|uniref:Uncharacterized protein n=1 Tax=Streptomyces hygroscopicus TaxID=1912 RepID=A0ABQ3TU24_STRHY|nr:hypothetical protein TPA0910_12710 [Streptomyces hygroscopicus]
MAVAEAQGYAYDTLVRTARPADELWKDEPHAHRLRAAAARLRSRFTTGFCATTSTAPTASPPAAAAWRCAATPCAPSDH